MVEGYAELQDRLASAELRLTDHALLGTDEETEKLAKTAGPGGELLRALYTDQQKLAERQIAQKGVLVQAARKSVATGEAHDASMVEASVTPAAC